MRIAVTTFAVIASLLLARSALAQDEPDAGATPPTTVAPVTPTPAPAPTPTPIPTPVPPTSSAPPAEPALAPDTTPLTPFPGPESTSLKVTPEGYIEAYYAYNFNHPANNVTNFRGYDNRANTFTLQNAAIGARFENGPVSGKLMLQVGSTGSTYYLAEPGHTGTSTTNASGPELWKYLQEAYLSYKAPIGSGLQLTAGLFASPIGMEHFAVKDNWNYSHSNLYTVLPKYGTGVRATYDFTDRLTGSVSVVNGWDSVVDNNDAKTVEGHLSYSVPKAFAFQVLYMGGIERPGTAAEGQYWRHHFDAFGEVDVASWLALAAQADAGFETNRFGTADWYGGALAARAKACHWLYFAVRGDRIYENLATDSSGAHSTALFWGGVEWVSSATVTAEVRPHDNISVRLEFRHDQADGLLYFTKDTIVGDGSATSPYVTNARRQETLLLGATAWF